MVPSPLTVKPLPVASTNVRRTLVVTTLLPTLWVWSILASTAACRSTTAGSSTNGACGCWCAAAGATPSPMSAMTVMTHRPARRAARGRSIDPPFHPVAGMDPSTAGSLHDEDLDGRQKIRTREIYCPIIALSAGLSMVVLATSCERLVDQPLDN